MKAGGALSDLCDDRWLVRLSTLSLSTSFRQCRGVITTIAAAAAKAVYNDSAEITLHCCDEWLWLGLSAVPA